MRSFYRWLAGSLVCGLFAVSILSCTTVSAPPPRDRILVLVSLDGFRWDYLQRFNPTNLNRLAAEGVRAERLISAFPSLTFPNHYTIVTGLWPEHHGIIGNSFYDPAFQTNFAIFNNPGPADGRWWGGEPIWVTAIKQGRVADCMFWPGSGAAIQGIRPTEWKAFDKKTDTTNRVDTVLGWLAEPAGKRPSLVTLYFHEPDTAAHHDGTESAALTNAVAQMDVAIGRLVDGIHRLKLDDTVNLVIVSDHGMTGVSTNRIIALSDFVDLDEVRVDFSGAVAGLRPHDTNEIAAVFEAIKAKQNHFSVYRKENMPERFHFNEGDRIPPVILVADEGWFISRRPPQPGRDFEKATHGFDPQLESMGATFIAWGPAFRHGVVLPSVENVNIYNLLCATLGLTPAPNDGDDQLVKAVLAK